MCLFIVLQAQRTQSFPQSVVDFYTQYTTNEGLSSNTCLSLLEDSRGLIWIGTAEGLNRFDGHGFRKYFHNPSDTNSICGNTVTCLNEDKSGRIWIGTYGSGLTCYDPKNEAYRHYTLVTPGLPLTRSNRIENIAILADGRVFCSTEAGLFVMHYNESSFHIVDASYLGVSEFTARHTRILHDKARNGIWINTMEGILFYHGDSGITEFSSQQHAKWEIMDVTGIMNIRLDKNNRLWYYRNADSNLYVFDPELNQTNSTDLADKRKDNPHKLLYSRLKDAVLLSYWAHPSMFFGTSNAKCTSEPFELEYPGAIGEVPVNDIICDALNLEWIATAQGLYVRRGDQPERQLQWISDRDEMVSDALIRNEKILIATNKGLVQRDLKSGVEQRLDNSRVNYLCELKSNKLILLGKDDGIHQLDPISGVIKMYLPFSNEACFSFKKDAIQFIHPDSMGRLWIGTWSGNLTWYDPGTSEVLYHASNKIEGLHWPKSGLLSIGAYGDELYIGFNGGDGVWKWNSNEKTFSPYLSTKDHPKFNGVSDAMYIDDERIYVGTHGTGLAVWDKKKSSFEYITRHNGLVGDYVYRIDGLDEKRLLVVTNSGICIVRTDNLNVRLINNDFPQEIPLFSFSGRRGEKDEFWFWYRSYYYALRAEDDWNPLRQPLITGFTIFDRSVSIPETHQIQLNYDENFFTIEFSGLPFLNKERMEYAYKLEGINEDWVITRATNLAPYTNVPGGDYVFLVKSRMDGSEWTNPTEFRINIKPPYWTTWWFRGSILLAIGFIVYGIYRYRINQLVKMQAVRNRISSDLHDDVGASLSSINIYSKVALEKLKRSPEEVPEMLEQISRNATDMMDNMSDIVWSINPRNDNLESLVNRMKIHAIEALQPLDMDVQFVTGDLPENSLGMNARKNLYLVFKEIINNIAKHSKAKMARIEVSAKGDLLFLEISDDGIGISEAKGKGGNGLLSLKNRVTEMHGKLEIESKPNQGTTLRIELSLARISDGRN